MIFEPPVCLICSADHSGKNGCKPEEPGIDTKTYAGSWQSWHEGGVEVWKEPPPGIPLKGVKCKISYITFEQGAEEQLGCCTMRSVLYETVWQERGKSHKAPIPATTGSTVTQFYWW